MKNIKKLDLGLQSAYDELFMDDEGRKENRLPKIYDRAMLEDWTIYSWYCPNCRNEVAGLKNSKNQIRVKCKTCGSEMVRTIVGRRHDVIDIYAPSGQEHNDLELRR